MLLLTNFAFPGSLVVHAAAMGDSNDWEIKEVGTVDLVTYERGHINIRTFLKSKLD